MESNNMKMSMGRLILTIVMLCIVIVGGTFAWFTYSSRQSALVLTVGDINDTHIILSPYQVKGTLTPVNTYTSGVSSKVEVINDNDSTSISLFYKINELDQNLIDNGLKYTITSSTSENGTYSEVKTGDFTEFSGQDEAVIYETKTKDSSKVYYKVYLWVDSTVGNQTEIQNSVLDVELNGSITQDATKPEVATGMIPVVISDSGVVTTIDEDDENWYDYGNKKWANVVLVDSDSRSSYVGTKGKTVAQNDILAYYVWIPRFRYKIWTTTTSSAGKEQNIDIVFEEKNDPMSLQTTVGLYRTHPAFWFDADNDGAVDNGETLGGIWVGKFETTGSASIPTVLPNTTPLQNQSVSTQFDTALKFSNGTVNTSTGKVTFTDATVGVPLTTSTYGLPINADSHMMKNSEWGAVAYLAHSDYGLEEEIRLNNNSNHTTGCGASSVNGAATSSCQIAYASGTKNYPQSTTGNITGIFGMSGGANEYVMGNYNGAVGSSGFTTLPAIKYYDKYTFNSMSSCTLNSCGGHALFETNGWYSDNSGFVNSSAPWFTRGGNHDSGVSEGMFYASGESGATGPAFHTTVITLPTFNVSYNANGGSGTPGAQTKVQGVDLTLSSTASTWHGHTFLNWNTKADGSGTDYSLGASYTTNADALMYAKWKINQYNIVYDYDGGVKGSKAPNGGKFEEVIQISNPTKVGYTFTGWTFDGDTTNAKYGPNKDNVTNVWSSHSALVKSEFFVNLSVVDGSTVTLKANWTPNVYNISYSLNGGTNGSKAPTKDIVYDTSFEISNPIKKITITGNANGTGADIGAVVSGNHEFLGWTSTTINTSTAYYGTSNSTITTAWTDTSTKVKDTWFKNLHSINGRTVTMVANWKTLTLTMPTVSKEGNTCEWNTKADGSGTSYKSAETYTSTPENTNTSITLYARCVAHEHTINYEYTGGKKGTNAPDKGTYGSVVTIDNPTKTVTITGNANGTGATVGTATSGNHVFAGWTSSNINTSTALYGSSNSAVTTKWSNGSTKVTYRFFKNLTPTKNGTVTLVANWNDLNVTVPTITKTGYTCGWNTKADGSGTSYTSGGTYKSLANTTTTGITLYGVCAVNSYNIEYDYAGGTKGTNAPTSANYDSVVNISNPTRTGYTFAGWTSTNINTNTAYYGASNTAVTTRWSSGSTKVMEQYFKNLTPTSNGTVKLVANWTANKYTIGYTYNGGTKGTNAPTSADYDSVVTIDNPTKTVTVTGNANNTGATVSAATSAAQTFAGWTSTTINTSTAYYGASNTAVTTRWSSGSTKVTYRFFKNLIPTNSGTVTLVANWTPVAISALPTATKTGYTCSWNTKADGTGTTYSSGGSYTPAANSAASVTLYAVCTAKQYTITLNGNGATTAGTASVKATYNSSAFNPASITLPKREYSVSGFGLDASRKSNGATVSSTTALTAAYTLKGWYTASTEGSKVINSSATLSYVASVSGYTDSGSKWIRDDNATLYAQWTSKAVTLPTITKPGYTCGWTTSSTGTTISYASGASYTPTAATTMYGVCTANEYTITLNGNGATTAGTATVKTTYDSSSFNPASITLPKREYAVSGFGTDASRKSNGATISSTTALTAAYTLKGWYTAASNGSKVINNSATLSYVASVSGYTNASSQWVKAGNATLYAQWTSKAVTLPTITKAGYTCGWTTSSTGTTISYASGASYTPSAATTMYAVCTANSYTITYHLGNGTSTAGSTSIGTSTCTYDSSCTLKTWSSLGKTFPESDNHWSFGGWGTSESDTSVDHTDGANFTYNSAGNINLYAIGKRTFKFYSGKAPTSVTNSQTQYWNPHSTDTSYLSSITIPTATAITGWTYLGYRATNDASSTTTFSTTGSNTPAANSLTGFDFRTIYQRNVTINYDGNGATGGSTAPTTAIQYYNSGIASSGSNVGANVSTPSFTLASNGFTKDGLTFSKWADGSVSGTQYAAGATYNAFKPGVSDSAAKTMYAIWVDGAAPTISSATASSTLDVRNSVTFTAIDAGSGIVGYNITTSNTAPTTWIPLISTVENATETKYAYDAAWARVFHHNSHWGSVLYSKDNSYAEAKSSNTVDKYSVLGSMANYKNSSGVWEMLLEYPTSSLSGYNRWKQTSNPATTSESVTGYVAVNTSWTGNNWGGLAVSNSGSTFMDGSVNNSSWWYAIGATSAYKGGIPGGNDTIVSHINLWNRIDDKSATAIKTSVTRTIGDIASNGDYYVWVKDSSGNTASKKVTVSNVDTTNPTLSLTANSANVIKITSSDNKAVTKYYYGTSNPTSTNITWVDSLSTTTPTVSAAGTYYAGVQDAAGNRATSSINAYSISYNVNGGESSTPATQYKLQGTTITLAAAPTRAGYTFDGWYDAASGGNKIGNAGGSYSANANATLYAHWTINRYGVTYDYNDSSTYSSTQYMNTGYKINYDNDFIITETFKVTTSGKRYLLIGNHDGTTGKELNIEINASNQLRVWIANGSTNLVDKSGGTVTMNENIVLTFTWTASTKTYTISAVGTSTNISFSGTANITGTAANALRIGTIDYRIDTTTFSPIYVSSLKISTNKSYGSTLSDLPTVTRNGYIYNGWYTASTGGTKISTSTTVGATAVTYYLQGSTNTYKIGYSLNGGTKGTNAPTTATYDQIVNISPPTKLGYVFAGWTSTTINTSTAYYGTSNTTVTSAWSNTATKVMAQYFKNLTPTKDATVTLVANWTAVEYTVTYDTNDGDFLPSGYTPLAYIESTGMQYINTGFIPDNNSRIVMNFELVGSTFGALYGARKATTNSVFGMWIEDGKAYPHYGNVGYTDIGVISTTTTNKIKYDMNGSSINVNGTTRTGSNTTFDSGYPLTLLTLNDGGVMDTRYVSGKLYSTKIYDNGVLVRNFVPAENSSGTVGLFDTVGQKFYTNAGNGSFKAGPVTTTYNITTDAFDIYEPSRDKYIFNGYTEQISTSTWYNGFVNLEKGTLQSYDASYPNSVYSELIYLEAGVNYTLNGTGLGGIRWRYYETDGVTYVGNVSSTSSYTPSQAGYVRILLYEGASETNRNAAYISSSQGSNVVVPKGSTGNRKYIANWARLTAIVTADSQGGAITSTTGWSGTGNTATKSVTYDSTYGSVPAVSKSGYTFRGWQLIPNEYIQLEYIESTGTQYIDTGYSAPNGFIGESEFSYTTVDSSYIIGSHNLNSPYGRNGFGLTANVWELGLGDNYPRSTITVAANTRYSARFSTVKGNAYLNIDETKILTSSDSTSRSSQNLFIFHNQYRKNAGLSTAKAKIYFMKIYDSTGVLVRDMVPCYRKSDGVAGMYDRLNGVFYTNAGTGDFVKGGVVTITASSKVTTEGNHKIYASYKDPGFINLSATSGSVNYKTTSATFDITSHHGGTLTVTDNHGTATSSISGTKVTIGSIGSLGAGTSVVVTVTSSETVSHTAASATYTLSIAKASCACAFNSIPSLAYPSAKTGTITYTCTGDGTVHLTNVSGNNYVTVDSGYSSTSATLRAHDAGTGQLYLSQDASTNYLACVTKSTDITVSAGTVNLNYTSENLLYGLDDIGNTTTDRMTYSVSNDVVTVKANYNDGYGYTNGRVYLEANKKYVFNASCSAGWGECEAFLMLNGSTSVVYYYMAGNVNYVFTPTVSGEYWLRLDVNTNGTTQTFRNITISEVTSTKSVTYGSSLSAASAFKDKYGYSFKGYYTTPYANDLSYSYIDWISSSSVVRIGTEGTANGWAMTSAGDIGKRFHFIAKVVDSSATSAPTLDFNDAALDLGYHYRVSGGSGTWFYYVDFELTSYMLRPDGASYGTTHRFIDFNDLHSGASVSVMAAVLYGDKYHNNTGAAISPAYFDNATTYLYPILVANNYTVTANAQSGSIPSTTGWSGTGASATKSVKFGKAYSTLPAPTRTGYSFGGWSLLPNGYQQVEYIESHGGEMINTGVSGNARWEFDIQFTKLGTRQLMGYGGDNNEYWGVQTDGYYGIWASSGKLDYKAGNRDKFIHNYGEDGVCYIQSNGYKYEYGCNSVASKTYKLFDIGYSDHYMYAKLYGLKTYQNGVLIRNFIPCYRQSDGVAGLFDTVNGQFYTTSSGKLTYGRANGLPEAYQPVDYIESTGTQYINTELNENAAFGMRMRFKVTGTAVAWQSLVSGKLDNFTVGTRDNDTTGFYIRLRGGEVYNTAGVLSGVSELSIKDGVVKLNNSQIATYTHGALSTNQGYMYLFANNALSRYGKMQLYEIEFYDNSGKAIRNLVPCYRKSDNVIGMYDVVTGKFFTNLGSGTFTKGGNVNSSTIMSSSKVSVPRDHTIYAHWIDTVGPTLSSVSASTTYDIRNWVQFTATDSGSGTVAYNVTTTNVAPSTWIPVVSAVEAATETKYAYDAAWARVFHHNTHWGEVFYSNANSWAEAKSSNTVDKYSVLGNMANYKTSGGVWEMLLEYPGVAGYNRWKQTSNPATTNESITGYSAVNVSWTSNVWGGMALSNSGSTFMDGSVNHGNWYYAIGTASKWSGAIPGPSDPISHVNLWNRIDDKAMVATTSAVTRRIGDLSANGTYYIWAKDMNGNVSSTSVAVSKVDNSAPTTPTTMEYVFGNWSRYTQGNWTNQDIYAVNTTSQNGPSGSTDSGGSGFKYQISSDGQNFVDYSYNSSVDMYRMSTNGIHTRWFRALDYAGNVSGVITRTAKIDKSAPSISVSNTYNGSAYLGAWVTSGSIASAITFSDSGGSGINPSSLSSSCDNTNWTAISNTSASSFNDTWSGDRNASACYYRICDYAGNCTSSAAFAIRIDKSNPTYSSAEIKNISPSGYDVYIYGLSDISGINRVQFPTWTEAGGQNDIQSDWVNNSAASGSNQGNGTWYYRVNVTDHNKESGAYNTHIYIYDNTGHSTGIGNDPVTVPQVAISYNMCGGTGGPSTQYKGYGVDTTLSTTQPSRAGHVFKGWTTVGCNQASPTHASGATFSSNSNTTLYAVYSVNISEDFSDGTMNGISIASDTDTHNGKSYNWSVSGGTFRTNTGDNGVWIPKRDVDIYGYVTITPAANSVLSFNWGISSSAWSLVGFRIRLWEDGVHISTPVERGASGFNLSGSNASGTVTNINLTAGKTYGLQLNLWFNETYDNTWAYIDNIVVKS